MSCVKDSSIIHGKLMAPNHGHEIDNCTIYDRKTRFMGFFQGILIKFTINPDK